MGLFVGDAGGSLGRCWVGVGLGKVIGRHLVGVGGRDCVRLGWGLGLGWVRF